MTGLKLIEAGLSSEKIALMALPMVPLQITLPWIIRYVYCIPHTLAHTVYTVYSRFTAGPRPLDVFSKAYLPRMLMGLVFALLVWWTSRVGVEGEFPIYYYIVLVGVFVVHQVRCWPNVN